MRHAWLTVGCALAIATSAAASSDPFPSRLSFGHRPGQPPSTLELQLRPDRLPEPPELLGRLEDLKTLRMEPGELVAQYRLRLGDPMRRTQVRIPLEQAVEARLARAVESPRQLQEMMVDFWFNHFNVHSGKGLVRFWVGAYEEQAIRPHALGRFRDLLGAVAKHPAMLFYLDNWQNSAPGSKGRFKGLNENYARELLELHTMGVDGGYSQQDVVELARILTGWGFSRRSFDFAFDGKRHDHGEKLLLGRKFGPEGQAEGEKALDMLAEHPATARYISRKLVRYFVADDPPEPLVQRLADRFLETRGDLRAVVETLARSPELQASRQYKTPYQYVISAVRASGQPVRDYRPLAQALRQLGMPLYGCPTPDGYETEEGAWLGPEAMTRRLSFAIALASGRLPLGIKPMDPTALGMLPGFSLGVGSSRAVAESPADLRAALMLGSPEFMRR